MKLWHKVNLPDLTEQWSTGMKCRAIFSEDGYEYEGEIISTMIKDGINYARIQYLGYGNEEYVDFDHILPSSGKIVFLFYFFLYIKF